jgi:hypothetical protein
MNIDRFIYLPDRSTDDDQCQARIGDGLRSYGRCSRRATLLVQGYRFCVQHGRNAERWIESVVLLKGRVEL